MKIGFNGYSFGSTKDRISQYTTFSIQCLVESNPNTEFVLFVAQKQKTVLPKNCQVVVIPAPKNSRKKWEKLVVEHPLFQSLDFFHSFQESRLRHDAVKTGITFHSALSFYPIRPFWRNWLQKARISREVKNSDLIITVTDILRKEISHAFSLPLDRIRVVPGAGSSYFQKPSELEAVKKVQKNISKGFEFLLYVGKVRKTSNIRKILEAFSQLVQEPRFSKLKLLITGRIPYHHDPLYFSEGEMKKMLEEFHVKSSVLLAGPVQREELRALYKTTRGVICDTTDLGFPNAAFEASLASAPMLIPQAQSYTEFFTDEYLRYDPKNPKSVRLGMNILADQAISKSEQITKAQMTAHSYSWEEAAQALMRAFTEVVEKNTKNR